MHERHSKILKEIYRILFDHFGPQRWWPTRGDVDDNSLRNFEVAAGAILTQNTNWKNVEKAIFNLKAENLLTPNGIHHLSHDHLARIIRPSGYLNVKARRLKSYAAYLVDRYDGNMGKSLAGDLETQRRELLAVHGIGPETADCILLYAGNRPIFVIDSYTKRIMARHRLVGEDAGYEEVQRLMMDNLEADAKMFNEFHALFVAAGKTYCRPGAPLCSTCPLYGV